MFDSPFSLTDTLISKFKAFKRNLTLSFLRLFPPVPTYSAGFFHLHFPPSFPFSWHYLPPAFHHVSPHLLQLLPSSAPSLQHPLLHTLSYYLCLSRLPVSFCTLPSLNSKSTIVSLSYLWSEDSCKSWRRIARTSIIWASPFIDLFSQNNIDQVSPLFQALYGSLGIC